MASLASFGYRLLVSLPHPLAELWVLWLLVALFEIHYLVRRRDRTRQLSRSGELMSFREIMAVGCIAGAFVGEIKLAKYVHNAASIGIAGLPELEFLTGRESDHRQHLSGGPVALKEAREHVAIEEK